MSALVVLHIVRRPGDELALETVRRAGPGHAVLLLGDGVSNTVPTGVQSFYSATCAAARGAVPPGSQRLADAAIIGLLCQAQKVVNW